MMGMQVKLTYTFFASGLMASIFITVTGLSERKFPKEISPWIKINSLCVGGYSVTLGNTEAGFVMLMRGKKGSEVLRYRVYRDEVFIPFIR